VRGVADRDAKYAALVDVPDGYDQRPALSIDHAETHEDGLPKEGQHLFLGQNTRLRIDRDDLHG